MFPLKERVEDLNRSDFLSRGVTFKLNRGRAFYYVYYAISNEIGFVGKLLQIVSAMSGWAGWIGQWH